MPIEDDYDPKYLGSLDDVPISGPDDYTASEKRQAIYHAESSLELDTNTGDEIDQSNLTNAHLSAVMNLATHVLTHAAEEPSDVTLGDMADGGSTITEYSSRYLDEYKRLVDRIAETGVGGGSSSGNFSTAVNTGLDE